MTAPCLFIVLHVDSANETCYDILGIPYKRIQGSEARSEGSAAEDRHPQMPHEGTLRRKAGRSAVLTVLGCRLYRSVAVIRHRLAERWSTGGGEVYLPMRAAGMSAGFFASLEIQVWR